MKILACIALLALAGCGGSDKEPADGAPEATKDAAQDTSTPDAPDAGAADTAADASAS